VQAEPRLLSLQRRFMAALREPIFEDSRERSELPPRAGAVSEEFTRTAEALITPSAMLKPVERLELYHPQYWYRLLESIAEDFTGLRWLLGDEAFWGLMEAYLEAEPPRSFTLRHLGAGLADFIAARAESVPSAAHAEDLARLEYALCAVFEAADRPPVRPEMLGAATVALQPHVRLLALRTPADTLWRRAERGATRGKLTPPTEKPSRFVAVFRRSLGLYVERLPKAAFAILSALEDGVSIELALERVTSEPGLLRRGDAPRVSRWFSTWMARGWLCHDTKNPDSRRKERSVP
jgi:hypothetical protein